jgi:hypothetical protein
MRRQLALTALTLLLGACADDDAESAGTTASVAEDVPGLVTAESLPGTWVALPPDDAAPLPICGQEVPSTAGQKHSEEVSLMSTPDERTVLGHRLIEYQDEAAAGRAVDRLRTIGATCDRYSRPERIDGGTAEIDVAPLSLPGHPTTHGLQLLITFEDGSGGAWDLTATGFGSTVSYVSVQAIQGGIPDDSYVGDLLDAVHEPR